MANEIWDCGRHLESIYRDIWNFLYVDGKPLLKGGKQGILCNHTEEEYIEELKSIARITLDTYTNLSNEYSWGE